MSLSSNNRTLIWPLLDYTRGRVLILSKCSGFIASNSFEFQRSEIERKGANWKKRRSESKNSQMETRGRAIPRDQIVHSPNIFLRKRTSVGPVQTGVLTATDMFEQIVQDKVACFGDESRRYTIVLCETLMLLS